MRHAALAHSELDGSGTTATSSREATTILLVEDEKPVLELVASVLRGWGYRVLEANDAEDAMRHGEDFKGPIHLMLSDVVMPQLSGPQLADRLRPLRPEMRVMFMSGYWEICSRYFEENQSSPLLLKPFSLHDMRQQIWQLLAPVLEPKDAAALVAPPTQSA